MRAGLERGAAHGLLAAVGAALVGLASTGLGADAAAQPRAASLCTAAETPLFTCAIGREIVSVCGGKISATYRYGRPGRVELKSRALTIASRSYSGGGETQITATKRDWTYLSMIAQCARFSSLAKGMSPPRPAA